MMFRDTKTIYNTVSDEIPFNKYTVASYNIK